MIILDRLHRGDRPCMVAVTAAQTKDRLVFDDDAGADAFIEAHRRADPASSFTKFEVPGISLADFWRACRDADWHYDASEDQRVWREGGAAASRLAVQGTISYSHRRMYIDWRRHVFSGPAYGTEKHPAPDEPASAIEARSDETPQAVQPEGQVSGAQSADAQPSPPNPPHPQTKERDCER